MIRDLIFQILLYVIQLAVISLIGFISYAAVKVAQHFGFKLTDAKVLRAVQAAEQVVGAGNGSDKKQLVVGWLTKAFGKKFDSEEIEQMVESAVFGFTKAVNTEFTPGAPALDKPIADIKQETAPAPDPLPDAAAPATAPESTPAPDLIKIVQPSIDTSQTTGVEQLPSIT